MLLALHQIDTVLSQVGVELVELILGQIDLFESPRYLVVGEEAPFLSILGQPLNLVNVWQSDVDREHVAAFRSVRGDGG